MCRRFDQVMVLVAGSLVFAGCSAPLTGPIKEIESPQPRTYYTSVPVPRAVAQASFEQPLTPVDPDKPPTLKPYAQWTEQDAAVDALGRIGPAAVPSLAQALHSADPQVRLKAVEVLARMGSDASEAVPDLVALLDDPDERIRKAATRTLGRIGPEAAPAVPALMRSLLQPEPHPPVELKPVPRE